MVKDNTSIKIKEDLEISRKNEALLAKLLENSSQPFGVGYPDGRLGLVNKAFEELTGYSREELKSTDWSKILTPPEFQSMENEKLEELQRTGQPVRYEKEYIRKDRTRIPIELLVNIVKNEDGTPEYYYSFITDISERKISEKLKQELLEKEQELTEELQTSNEELQSTTEELQVSNEELHEQMDNIVKINQSLKESEEKFSKAFHSNSAAMTVTRMDDGLIIDANESFETLFGYSYEETVGHSTNELGIWLTPQERDAEVEQLLKLGKLPWHEVTFGTKSGENIYVLFSVELIHIKGQMYILTTSMDINERKKAEKITQELLEKEQQLTEELKVSNEELQSTSEELEATNKELMHQGDELLKINKALEMSEERYKNILNNLQEAYIRADKDGNIIMANPSAARIYGYDSPHDMIGTTALYYYKNPEDRAYVLGELKKHGKVENNEIEALQKDGTSFFVSQNAQFYYDGNGQILGTETLVHDITERKKADDELKKRAALLDVSYEAIFSWEYDGEILSWNKGAERLYGYNDEEAIGHVSHELLKTQFPIEFREFMKKLTKDKIWTGEITHTTNNGQKLIVESRQQLIQDPVGKKIVIETNRDITERKEVEKNLFESEERLRLAQNSGNVGIWDWNTITNELNFTPELEQLYGLSPGTIKTYNDWRELTHPDDIEKIELERDEKIANQEPFDLEFRIFHKSSEIHWLSAKGGGIYNQEGDLTRVLGINMDITERKKAEEKMKTTMDELEHSNKELEQFAYITSHDLREPLRMITSFLQLLERRYKDQLDQDANEFIGFAVDGAKRLDAMTNDLLQYSKITSKKREITPVNFEHVLEHALTNLKVPIEENKAVITHDPLPTINGDEQLKVQLFQNLIGNAIKYRGEENPKIHISATKEKNSYLFSIKDNGIGISSEHLERIFTIFQRLHTNDEYEGTGIGLSIAQKIVYQQGGVIWAESELDKGSTFYFTIPIKN